MDPIEYKQNPLVMLPILYCGILFFLLGLGVIITAAPNTLFLLGIICMVLSTLCIIFPLYRILIPRVSLNLSEEGLYLNESGFYQRLIPWKEIAKTENFLIDEEEHLAVHVKDPELYLLNGSVIEKITAKGNYTLSGTPVMISLNRIGTTYQEIFKNIEFFMKNKK